MNRTPQYRITAGGQSVQLRGNARNARPANRARASRFLPRSLSLALAQAFDAASSRVSHTLTRLSLTLAGLASMQANVQAQSSNLPQGGVAVHGSATMQQNGNTLNVNTTNGAGNRSIINWQSFNIGAGHTTNINQPTRNQAA
ncbi:MAG: hypothetical protein HC858_06310 [Brachymonas sp.]|nr:hypothetical protein [Brachymonas sp.]